jgi:hypothetical protein
MAARNRLLSTLQNPPPSTDLFDDIIGAKPSDLGLSSRHMVARFHTMLTDDHTRHVFQPLHKLWQQDLGAIEQEAQRQKNLVATHKTVGVAAFAELVARVCAS